MRTTKMRTTRALQGFLVCWSPLAFAIGPDRMSFHYSTAGPENHLDWAQTQRHRHSERISAAEAALLPALPPAGADGEEPGGGNHLYLFSDAGVRVGQGVLKSGSGGVEEAGPFYAAQLGAAGFRGSYGNPFLMKAAPGFRYEHNRAGSTSATVRGKWSLKMEQGSSTQIVPMEFAFPNSELEEPPMDLSLLTALAEAEAALLLFESAAAVPVEPGARGLSYFTDSLDLVRSLEMGFLEVRRGNVAPPASGEGFAFLSHEDAAAEESYLRMLLAVLRSRHQGTEDPGLRRERPTMAGPLPPWFAAYRLLRRSGLLAALVASMMTYAVQIESFLVMHVRSASAVRRALLVPETGDYAKAAGAAAASSMSASSDEDAETGLRSMQVRGPFMLGNQLADDLASSFHLMSTLPSRTRSLDFFAGAEFSELFADARVKRKKVFRGTGTADFLYHERAEIWVDLAAQTRNILKRAQQGTTSRGHIGHLPSTLDAYAQSAVAQYGVWSRELLAKYKEHESLKFPAKGREGRSPSLSATAVRVFGGKFWAGDAGASDLSEMQEADGEWPSAENYTEEEIISPGTGDGEPEEVAPLSPLEQFRAWARPVLPRVELPKKVFHSLEHDPAPLSADVETGLATTAMTTDQFVCAFADYETKLKNAFLVRLHETERQTAGAGELQPFPSEGDAKSVQDWLLLASFWARLRVLRVRVRPGLLTTIRELEQLSAFRNGAYKKLVKEYATEAKLKLHSLPDRFGRETKSDRRELVNYVARHSKVTTTKGQRLTEAQRKVWAASEVGKNPEKVLQEVRTTLVQNLSSLRQNLKLVVPIGINDTRHDQMADQLAQDLRASALPAVDAAVAELEERFLALVEELFGGGAAEGGAEAEMEDAGAGPTAAEAELSTGEADVGMRSAREEASDMDESASPVNRATEAPPPARRGRGGRWRRLVQASCRKRLGTCRRSLPRDTSDSGSSMDVESDADAETGEPGGTGRFESDPQDTELAPRRGEVDAIQHMLQFAGVMNDLGRFRATLYAEYDHLEDHANDPEHPVLNLSRSEREDLSRSEMPQKSADAGKKSRKLTLRGPLPPAPVRMTLGGMLEDARRFLDVVVVYRGEESGKGWPRYMEQILEANRDREPLPTRSRAVALLEKNNLSFASAAGGLPVTPWAAAAMLSAGELLLAAAPDSSAPADRRKAEGAADRGSFDIGFAEETSRASDGSALPLSWAGSLTRDFPVVPDLRVSLLLAGDVEVVGKKGKKETSGEDVASEVRRPQIHKKTKYGNALLHAHVDLYGKDGYAHAKKRIDEKKQELADLFFRMTEMMLVPPPASVDGRSRRRSVQEVLDGWDAAAANYDGGRRTVRETLRVLVDRLLSKVFVEQVEMVIAQDGSDLLKRDERSQPEGERSGLTMELAADEWLRPFGFLGEGVLDAWGNPLQRPDLVDKIPEWAATEDPEAAMREHGARELGTEILDARLAGLFEEFWQQMDNFLHTMAIAQGRSQRQVVVVRSERAHGRRGVVTGIRFGAAAVRAPGPRNAAEGEAGPASSGSPGAVSGRDAPGARQKSDGFSTPGQTDESRTSDEASERKRSRALWQKAVRRALENDFGPGGSGPSLRDRLVRFLGLSQFTKAQILSFKELEDKTLSGHLQFAPPKHEASRNIDSAEWRAKDAVELGYRSLANRAGTCLGMNLWREPGTGDTVRVGVLGRVHEKNQNRRGDAWLVVKLEGDAFMEEYENELLRFAEDFAEGIEKQNYAKFDSLDHLHASIATRVALGLNGENKKGHWHVANASDMDVGLLTQLALDPK